MALQPPRRRGASLAAGLLGVSRELRLENQRPLPVGRFDDLDRRLEGLDSAVRLSCHSQRQRQLAHGDREKPRFPNQTDRLHQVVDRPRLGDAELRRAELEQGL